MSAGRFRLCGWVTRAILIILAVCASASAQGRKVAVYTQVEASARKDFGESERNSLTEKIRGALRNNSGGYYQPMNDEEQGVFTQYAKQRGADSFTDPKQIVPLGEQSGAQFVCVVSVRLLFGKDHEISAKIYEVRTTDLKENGAAKSSGKITSGDALDRVADEVIEKMFGRRGAVGSARGTFVDSRGNRTYRTIKVGSQTWMAENLDYAGDGSKCYENKQENCTKYGRLYTWDAAMKACPAGWYVATDGEWSALMESVGGVKTAGTKLKSSSGWESSEGVSSNGTDEYGFSALPSGIVNPDGSFSGAGHYGFWWSTTEGAAYNVRGRGTLFDGEGVYWSNIYKNHLFSVRCVQ